MNVIKGAQEIHPEGINGTITGKPLNTFIKWDATTNIVIKWNHILVICVHVYVYN